MQDGVGVEVGVGVGAVGPGAGRVGGAAVGCAGWGADGSTGAAGRDGAAVVRDAPGRVAVTDGCAGELALLGSADAVGGALTVPRVD
ncbi:hypothetical protein ACFXPX_17165, partial [Kitasatospora sp. NPDC059146]